MTGCSRPAWAMYSNLQIKQAKVLDFWRGAEPAGIRKQRALEWLLLWMEAESYHLPRQDGEPAGC